MSEPDLAERLASWADALPDAVTSRLLREAAEEVERLRSNQTGGDSRLVALTDAEREAVRMAAAYCETRAAAVHQRWGSAMRGLLDRLG